jgi:hypothetical protein
MHFRDYGQPCASMTWREPQHCVLYVLGFSLRRSPSRPANFAGSRLTSATRHRRINLTDQVRWLHAGAVASPDAEAK